MERESEKGSDSLPPPEVDLPGESRCTRIEIHQDLDSQYYAYIDDHAVLFACPCTRIRLHPNLPSDTGCSIGARSVQYEINPICTAIFANYRMYRMYRSSYHSLLYILHVKTTRIACCSVNVSSIPDTLRYADRIDSISH